MPGVVVLLGGEPGIGKSTLLTQMLLQMLADQSTVTSGAAKKPAKESTKPLRVFYACGEESPSQISLRIDRMLQAQLAKKLDHKQLSNQLSFITSTDVDEICALVNQEKPDILIIDSIQSIGTSDLTGASGSVGQIRESTDRLITQAKLANIPTFLVGHITKDGAIAGPKILEHMVDAVLLLEGERSGQLRILRSLKNRFGATDEVGLFQAVDWGLAEVSNPSELFLENQSKAVSGAATVCVMEGTRPLLIEVQALAVKSQLAMPRRVGRGINLSRIQVLAAVLQKHAHLPLQHYDLFLSVTGGFKVDEPAIDLGLSVAIASSLSGKAVPQKTVFIGELGLLGEVRKVPYLARRSKEAKRLGFKQIVSAIEQPNINQVLKNL